MRLVAALAVLLGEVEGLGGERERALGLARRRGTPRRGEPPGANDWP